MPITHERSAATGSHLFERLAECGGQDLAWLIRSMLSLYAHTRYVCKLQRLSLQDILSARVSAMGGLKLCHSQYV